MPTDQVTQSCYIPRDTANALHAESLAEVHYASCDRDVYGAAVMFFLELNDAAVITTGNLRNFAVGWREIRPCQCLAFRIKAAEDDARLARAAFKACASDVNADRVERASAELSRLRGKA